MPVVIPDVVVVTGVVPTQPVLVIEVMNTNPLLVIEGGMPGPKGDKGDAGLPGQSAEDAVKYTSRTDFVGSDFIYKGTALPGTPENVASWSIKRITIVDGDFTTKWAEGSSEFIHSWSDRLSLVYL